MERVRTSPLLGAVLDVVVEEERVVVELEHGGRGEGAMGMGDAARQSMLSLMVDREALTLGANRAYLFSALATILAAGLIWLIPRPSPDRIAASQPGGH